MRAEFERRTAGEAARRLRRGDRRLQAKLVADKPKVATRKSSQMALEVINKVLPETIGGSADLTGSNNTNTPDPEGPFSAADRPAATCATASASTRWPRR
jgi:transketolase